MTEQELRAKIKAILAAHGMGDFGATQCAEAILDLVDEHVGQERAEAASEALREQEERS